MESINVRDDADRKPEDQRTAPEDQRKPYETPRIVQIGKVAFVSFGTTGTRADAGGVGKKP